MSNIFGVSIDDLWKKELEVKIKVKEVKENENGWYTKYINYLEFVFECNNILYHVNFIWKDKEIKYELCWFSIY